MDKEYRQHEVTFLPSCLECGECAAECFTGAIYLDDDSVPRYNQSLCILCHSCEELGCPHLEIN